MDGGNPDSGQGRWENRFTSDACKNCLACPLQPSSAAFIHAAGGCAFARLSARSVVPKSRLIVISSFYSGVSQYSLGLEMPHPHS